jgi:hypothetical protein
MKSNLLADITYYIHLFLVLFILVGFLILPSKWLIFYIILGLLILLDWNDLDGMCILTKVEHYFRTGKWVSMSSDEEDAPEFFRPFIRRFFGIEMERRNAKKLNNFIFLSLILIAFIRYVIYCNNKK